MKQVDKKKKKKVPNPTGKGGFGDNPQNINSGRWLKEASIPHQMRVFLTMTKKEIDEWQKKTPQSERTSAQQIALNSVLRSMGDLGYQKETTDRTSGKPHQFIETDSNVNINAFENIMKRVAKRKE